MYDKYYKIFYRNIYINVWLNDCLFQGSWYFWKVAWIFYTSCFFPFSTTTVSLYQLMFKVNLPLNWCVLCKNVVHCMGKNHVKVRLHNTIFKQFYICNAGKSNGQGFTQPDFRFDFKCLFTGWKYNSNQFWNDVSIRLVCSHDIIFGRKHVKRKNWTKNDIMWSLWLWELQGQSWTQS